MAVRQRTMPPPQLDNSSSRNTSCSRRRRTVMSLCYSLVLLLLANLSSALAFQSSPVRVAPAIRQPYQQLKRQPHSKPLSTARYGRNNDYFEDDEDDDDFYEEDDQDYSRKRRRFRDDLGEFRKGRQSSGLNLPSSFGRRDGWRLPDALSKSLLAGVFVLGVGLGVTVDSQVNTNPKDLASRDAIDQAAPNPTLCAKLGASAMAFDQRVFVSFNPFNVYVSQADVKPACVLREANVVPILRAKNLINDEEVRACKQNMNTWAYVGNLEDTPQLSCVYKSRDAQNEFLSDPKLGIGEDYLDDDRQKGGATGKIVKGGMTQAQKDAARKKVGTLPLL